MRLQLTNKEKQVTELTVSGKLYKEIADKLGISIATVKNHLVNIRRKNGLGNSIDLVRRYIIQNPKKYILSILFLSIHLFAVYNSTHTDLKTPRRMAKVRTLKTRKIS